MKITSEQGFGMMEVLVALLILALAVMGFTALQLRAVDATSEAMYKIEAMNIARDLAERIRVNKSGLTTYTTELNKTTQVSVPTKNCLQTGTSLSCSSAEMARFDSAKIVSEVNAIAMKIALPNCEVSGSINRTCVYVSWGGTLPTNSTTDPKACTAGGAYLPQAKCIVMELY